MFPSKAVRRHESALLGDSAIPAFSRGRVSGIADFWGPRWISAVLQRHGYKAARCSRYWNVLCKGMERCVQVHLTATFHPHCGFACLPCKELEVNALPQAVPHSCPSSASSLSQHSYNYIYIITESRTCRGDEILCHIRHVCDLPVIPLFP